MGFRAWVKICLAVLLLAVPCEVMGKVKKMKNPLLTEYEYTPFDKLDVAVMKEAIEEGIKLADAEIEAICGNPAAPTFENTIVALERSGRILSRASLVAENLNSAETSEELQNMLQDISPKLTKHGNDIHLNKRLFARVKAVYEGDRSGLTPADVRLLTDTYKSFERSGANLSEADQTKFRELSERLAMLTLKFEQNVLKSTNAFVMHVTDEKELSGLPENAKEQAAQTAKEKGLGGWAFTLQYPSYAPFLTYGDNRERRRELSIASGSIANEKDSCSNFQVVKDIVNCRMELARLLGYETYADYVLEHRMAGSVKGVNDLLEQLIDNYLPVAKAEVQRIQELAPEPLQPWDFSYYSNKLRQRDYSFDDELLRPYFELDKVIDGVFGLATQLYGIKFVERPDVPVYHKDVKAYDIYDADGRFLALIYTDFFPRDGKRSGAWMTAFRSQYVDENGKDVRPQVSIVMNFTKPTDNTPSLLSHYELSTFLHEFGHALHGIFSDVKHESQCSPNVYWDFVEMPSQMMENFGYEPAFLKSFAKHYKTGETIPDELIEKLLKVRTYNAAYSCMRQVSFCLMDMAYYTRKDSLDTDPRTYERTATARVQLLPAHSETCMSSQFQHIMSGGYAAGYYSYKWSEVLDADVFEAIAESQKWSDAATRLRREILSKGDTEDPMRLYVNFRGRKPSIEAMLRRDGIKIKN